MGQHMSCFILFYIDFILLFRLKCFDSKLCSWHLLRFLDLLGDTSQGVKSFVFFIPNWKVFPAAVFDNILVDKQRHSPGDCIKQGFMTGCKKWQLLVLCSMGIWGYMFASRWALWKLLMNKTGNKTENERHQTK